MTQYIMAHDLGTSSDKAVLVDFEGNIAGSAAENYDTYYPNPAWVEQDPQQYWEQSCRASKRIIDETGINPADVKGVIFSTQAQGIIPVAEDGTVLYRNITWVDGRAEKQAKAIMKKVGGEKIFRLFTGTPIMGKDVLAKVMWLKEERPDIWKKTYKILDVNGYMKYMCTGKMVTEISGASSFALDLKKKEWMGVLSLLGMDMVKLPPLVTSTDFVGGLLPEAAEKMGLLPDTPVFGGCDDVQAAAVGSGMVEDGQCHIYLGTSAWVCTASKDKDKFMHGAAPIQSADKDMLLVAGITESAGANIQWAADTFYGEISRSDDIYDVMNSDAEKVPPGSDHLVITPWMLGERCPVSSTTARSTVFNLSMNHTRGHFIRAIYEGLAYNLRWILKNYRRDYGFNSDRIRVIGGGTQSDVWMQIIADVTGSEISVVADARNAGAKGAAIIAMIGLGRLPGFDKVNEFVKTEKTFRPDPKNASIYNVLFKDYKNIYSGLKTAYQTANAERFTGGSD